MGNNAGIRKLSFKYRVQPWQELFIHHILLDHPNPEANPSNLASQRLRATASRHRHKTELNNCPRAIHVAADHLPLQATCTSWNGGSGNPAPSRGPRGGDSRPVLLCPYLRHSRERDCRVTAGLRTDSEKPRHQRSGFDLGIEALCCVVLVPIAAPTRKGRKASKWRGETGGEDRGVKPWAHAARGLSSGFRRACVSFFTFILFAKLALWVDIG